jgi:hypothetical protein
MPSFASGQRISISLLANQRKLIWINGDSISVFWLQSRATAQKRNLEKKKLLYTHSKMFELLNVE